MKRLADWSPEALNKIYLEVLDRLSDGGLSSREKRVYTQRKEAIYCLGTHHDMKDVWKKLLSKKPIESMYLVSAGLIGERHPNTLEIALVSGIQEVIWQSIGIDMDKVSDKKIQLEKITEAIKDLQSHISKSGYADYEDGEILTNILHKRNVEYRNQLSEGIKPQAFLGMTLIDGDAQNELEGFPFEEHKPWSKRTQAQRLAWWTKSAMRIRLTDILDYYSERMSGYLEFHKDHYAIESTRLSLGLSRLMDRLYGKPLDAHVGSMITAIFDDKDSNWDKDRVRKIRSYRATKKK